MILTMELLTTYCRDTSYLQYNFLVREKIADGALISKWRKPGYEILCSLLAIQKGNHNFGTTSHCRVPMKLRAPQQRITPDVQTGCICCASGDGKFGGPIWWNTPLDDTEETAEQNRTTWVQVDEDDNDVEKAEPPQDNDDGEYVEAQHGTRKRNIEEISRGAVESDDEDELPDEVQKRLAALRDNA